ncbi:MAG: hypothetical protein WD906_06200 [Anaerolineales bacterium]
MQLDWQQLLATVLSNAVLLAAVGFLGKRILQRWIDRNLEGYKSKLKRAEIEHETKFALLHEKQAAVIAELYRLLIQMLRSVNRSAQGVHQYVDDQVATPRDIRQAQSVQYLRDSYAHFRAYDEFLEANRIYLSDELIAKTTELRKQLISVFDDLELSHMPTPPGHGGLPPSIKAIWDAQKKLRLLVQPVRGEIELEFRRILGVIDQAASA